MLAASYLELGRLKRSVRHRHLAVSLCEEEGDLSGQAKANNNLGVSYQLLGDLEKALHHYEIGLEFYHRIGNLIDAAIAHNNIGEILLIQGRLEQAASHLEEVVSTYERAGDPLAAAGLSLVNLCRVCQRQQDFEKASEYLQRGIELLSKVGARALVTEAYLQQAELHLEKGQLETARRMCQQALRRTRELASRVLEARALRILGRINMMQNDPGAAEDSLRQSITLARQLNADYERGLALLFLAALYRDYPLKDGIRRHYKSVLKQAIAIFRRIGAQLDLSQALALE
jgi:tetratricopeptide (TPR) repeat protein